MKRRFATRCLCRLGTLALLLTSCGEVFDAPWELRFDTPSLRARAIVIEVRIRRGGCDGGTVYDDVILPGTSPNRPPRLGEGTYGFEARARDATCTFFAEGCSEVDLPSEETVTVALGAEAGEARCEGTRCLDGYCEGVDFGEGRPPLAPRPLQPGMGARAASPLRFRWSSVPGATRYELATNPCPGPFASCDLDGASTTTETSSSVSITLANGRHGWRVRACDESRCSGWSAPRYVNVGAPFDLNDDGLGDVLVGAPREPNGANDNAGAAYAYPGTFGGVGAGADRFATVPEAGARHGSAMTSVDVEGDGALEIFVGAPFADEGSVDEGRVVLFPGARTLASAEPRSAATFGASLASCDVDADGYGDVVVGAPQRDEGRGRVEVLFGDAAARFTRRWTLGSPAPQTNARFGARVACGDVDADGFPDVMVAAPGADRPSAPGGGSVYVFSAEGPPTIVLTSPEDETGAGFGTDLAVVGDVDGDGVSDVLVGAPNGRGGEGRAFLFRGRIGSAPLAGQALTSPGTGSMDAFGAAVAGGADLDGDLVDDFAVGAPGASQVYVYLGSDTPGDLSLRHERLLDGPGPGSQFGASLALVEVSGDVRADLLVGAPAANATLVHLGTATGVSVIADERLDPVIADAGFGAALAR